MTAPITDLAAAVAALGALPMPAGPADSSDCFLRAAERTHSPSDRLAFYLDARLVRDQAPVATDTDYPAFAEWIAARQAEMNRARKEAK